MKEAAEGVGVEAVEDPLFSLGGVGHPQLCQRACVRFARGECHLGSECTFCHHTHEHAHRSLDKRERGLVQSYETWSPRHLRVALLGTLGFLRFF